MHASARKSWPANAPIYHILIVALEGPVGQLPMVSQPCLVCAVWGMTALSQR